MGAVNNDWVEASVTAEVTVEKTVGLDETICKANLAGSLGREDEIHRGGSNKSLDVIEDLEGWENGVVSAERHPRRKTKTCTRGEAQDGVGRHHSTEDTLVGSPWC